MSKEIQESAKWFKEAKYGMMVHFGLYSLLGGEWKGMWKRDYAEWVQPRYRIKKDEYSKLASAFNPIFFNADEWVGFARDCGMKYIVVTAKHHEGFALFHSKADSFNVVDASPFKRDIIEELAEACRKYGLRLGLYYSQDLDWHEKDGGGYLSRNVHCSGVSWDNSWDWPEVEGKDYSRCFEKKIRPQVEELMTQYGDIELVWFDTPMTINREQSCELANIIKKNQPGCLINSRIGNGVHDYVSLGDNEIPDCPLKSMRKSVDANDINGFKESTYNLYESACTLNHSWGFSYRDQDWKSAEVIRSNREKLNALGVNYLINVGPDGLGRIPGPSIDILSGAR